jgi:hypothetical protein
MGSKPVLRGKQWHSPLNVTVKKKKKKKEEKKDEEEEEERSI